MKIIDKVKNLLAQHIGVEVEDIKNEDLLSEDLHMSATDISDFLEILENEGVNVSKINLEEIESVEELIEAAASLDLE